MLSSFMVKGQVVSSEWRNDSEVDGDYSPPVSVGSRVYCPMEPPTALSS